MVVLRWKRIHHGWPGNTEDYYDIVREYENGQKVFQKKPKEAIDKVVGNQTARFVEKVGVDVIAKYLLLEGS